MKPITVLGESLAGDRLSLCWRWARSTDTSMRLYSYCLCYDDSAATNPVSALPVRPR
jgi:hypothetical protein